MIVLVGAALGRAQLVTASAVLVVVGTLLLLDLNGVLERFAPSAPRRARAVRRDAR